MWQVEVDLVTRDLSPLVAPKSIAVIGVSRSGGGWGVNTVKRLRQFGYIGDLYTVGAPEMGLQAEAVESLGTLPSPVDLLIVAVPAVAVPDVIQEAQKEKACRSALVFSSGFAELDDDGRQREVALRGAANGMPLLGPNCLGIVNRSDRVYASMSQYLARPELPPPGRVGIISQSGALGFILAHQLERSGVSFSQYVSVGNEACLGVGEIGLYLLERDDVSVLGLYLEAVRNTSDLASLAEKARALGKSVVALKTGTTGASQRATLSHTAAVAGDPLMFDAFCRFHGIVQADSDESFGDLLVALQRKASVRRGDRSAVITMSGGAGALLCDKLSSVGLEVPELSPTTQDAIRALPLKGLAGVSNPIDLGGQARESYSSLGDLLGLLENDPLIDIIVGYFTFGDDILEQYAEIAGLLERLTKPAWLVWGGQPKKVPVLPPGVTVGSIEQLARVLRGLTTVGDSPVPGGFDSEASHVSETPLTGIVTEARAWKLLAAEGVPYVETAVFSEPREVVVAGASPDSRFVVKIDSVRELHRFQAGLVKLDVRAEEIDRVAEELWEASRHLGDRSIVVQPQVKAGIELSVGVLRDEQYGLVVIAGLGGTDVEKVSTGRLALVCPATDSAVEEFCGRLVGHMPTVDREALAMVVRGVQRLGLREKHLESMDVNPLIVDRNGLLTAVDSLMICTGR